MKLVWLPALLSIVVAVAYGHGGQANAQTIPPTLQAAIEEDIVSRGYPFAGDCAGVSQDEDTGKWCYSILSMSESRAVVRIGATFAEFLRRLTFDRQGESWVLVSDVPEGLGAPDVGTGLAGDRGGTSEGLARLGMGVAAALIAASAAGAVVGRRTRGS